MKKITRFISLSSLLSLFVIIASAQTGTQKEVIAKYGLSLAQAKQYETIDAEKTQKTQAILDLKLSKEEHQKRTEIVRTEFKAKFKAILTPQQLVVLEQDQAQTVAQQEKLKKAREKYNADRHSLKSQGLPQQQEQAAQQALDDKYKAQLISILGKNEGLARFERQLNIQSAPAGIRKIDVSDNIVNELMKIRNARDQQIAALEKQPLSKKEKDAATRKIQRNFRQRAANILGATKYVGWERYKDEYLDRYMKDKMNMSKQQIAQFKDIVNRENVEISKIDISKLSSEQMQMKVDEIYKSTDASLKNILTEAQRDEINAFLMKRKANKIRPV